MNPFDPEDQNEREPIEATAAAWLAHRDGGMSREEENLFAAWRAADPRREAAVRRLESTWTTLQALRDYRPEARMHPDPNLLITRRHRRRFESAAWIPLGAAAAAALCAAVWFIRPRPAGPPALSYATTLGGYQRVELDDGSVMELNANTRAEVLYTARERDVRLLRGEAQFTVAKNKVRPFLVVANGVSVKAVGTAFDVRLDQNAVEVLVTEGRVQLDQTGHPSRDVSPPPLVTAGQRAVVSTIVAPAASLTCAVTPVSAEELREALTWEGPRLIFADTPLAEVAAQFNRRNQLQLVLGDPELGRLLVAGSFCADNVDAFVRLLSKGNGIRVERPSPNVIVLKKEPH